MKVIIIGRASCAARLRRQDEKPEIIMVERGPYVSLTNCGLPYHISGVIEKESSLLTGWKNSGCPWTYKLTPERMVLPKGQ